MRNQTYKYQHLWTKLVDNFADSYGQWFCSFFPIFFQKCLFKRLEISVKTQLADFRLLQHFRGFVAFGNLFFVDTYAAEVGT